jgi:DNA-binding response OmpR family regulator
LMRERPDRRLLVVMMSGHDNVTSLFAAGCPVLFKPFKAAELRELVAALLRDQLGVQHEVGKNP